MINITNIKMAFRYGFWGCLSASIYYALYFIFIFYLSLPALVSSFAAYSTSAISSFYFNSRFVFLGRSGSFIKFIIIALNGLLLNLLIIFFFTNIIIIEDLIAGLIAVVSVPIHNFILNNLLNFKNINDT